MFYAGVWLWENSRKYFRPVTEYGSTKYGAGNTAGTALRDTGLNSTERQQLEELYSMGLAKGTWSTYKTAERMLLQCCEEKGLERTLPASEDLILSFIHWMAFQRGVKAATIDTYLSGIRQLHIERGMPEAVIRTERVNMVLRGLRNKNNTEKRRGGGEGPATGNGRHPRTSQNEVAKQQCERSGPADDLDSVHATVSWSFQGPRASVQ